LIFRGRVQGVGFRAFAECEARQRGLDGWVRNRRDGAVEALFAGMESDVVGAIECCRKGPPAALVEAVEERPGDLIPTP
jgi:acylphosphatase